MDTTQTQQPQVDTVTTQKGGSSLAVIIVILIIALGGAFFWYSRATNEARMQEQLKTQAPVPEENLQNDLESSADVDISADLAGLDEVYK